MAVYVGKDGDWTLVFCISEVEEEIYGVGFMKGLRKNNKSEGRLRLYGVTTMVLIATRQRWRGFVEVVKAAVVLGWMVVTSSRSVWLHIW